MGLQHFMLCMHPLLFLTPHCNYTTHVLMSPHGSTYRRKPYSWVWLTADRQAQTSAWQNASHYISIRACQTSACSIQCASQRYQGQVCWLEAQCFQRQENSDTNAISGGSISGGDIINFSLPASLCVTVSSVPCGPICIGSLEQMHMTASPNVMPHMACINCITMLYASRRKFCEAAQPSVKHNFSGARHIWGAHHINIWMHACVELGPVGTC